MQIFNDIEGCEGKKNLFLFKKTTLSHIQEFIILKICRKKRHFLARFTGKLRPSKKPVFLQFGTNTLFKNLAF